MLCFKCEFILLPMNYQIVTIGIKLIETDSKEITLGTIKMFTISLISFNNKNTTKSNSHYQIHIILLYRSFSLKFYKICYEQLYFRANNHEQYQFCGILNFNANHSALVWTLLNRPHMFAIITCYR